jgi:hypothetical protein
MKICTTETCTWVRRVAELESKLAALRKVAEAARELADQWLPGAGHQRDALREALAALESNMEDPRFGATFSGVRHPLCDGCGGPENEEQGKRLAERLAAIAQPDHLLVVGDHVRCKGSERVGRVTEIGTFGARITYPWGQPALRWVHLTALERMIVSWEPAVLLPSDGDHG